MRGRTKPKETKESKKKKTKKVNNQDQDDEADIIQDNLLQEKKSKFSFFCLFDDELKKLDDISICYEDIHQRLLSKLEEFKNENTNQISNKNQNQNFCYSPSNNQNIDYEKLVQKFKTPLETKTKTVFSSLVKKNKPNELIPKFNIDAKDDNKIITSKSKKRSAIEISILIDEEKDEDKADGTKAKTSKYNAKKKSKLEKKENSKDTQKTPKSNLNKKNKQEDQHEDSEKSKKISEDSEKKIVFDIIENQENNTDNKKKKVKKTKNSIMNKKDSSEKFESDVHKSGAKPKIIKSVIDERKARLSKSRISEKRKSTIKVKKFLYDIVSTNNELKVEAKSSDTDKELMDKNNLNKKKISIKEPDDIKEDPDVTPTNKKSSICDSSNTSMRKSQIRISDFNANANSLKDEEMILDIKNKTPQLILQKIPSNILASGKQLSASQINSALTNQQKSITSNLSSHLTQSQLKNRTLAPQTISMSSIKSTTTPMKSIYQSLSNLSTVQQNNRQSFVKFWERNTPSKLTRTEMEERRKQEFLLKEKKEKERLEEIARQKALEKEKKKKQNDEKQKKMIEFKEKQKEEQEAKAREAEKKRIESEKKQLEDQENLKREQEKKKQEEIEEIKRKREELEAKSKENEKKKISIAVKSNIMASATKKPMMISVIKPHNIGSSTSNTNTDSILSKKLTIQNQKFQQQETLNTFKNDQYEHECLNQMQTLSKMNQPFAIPGISITSNKENNENLNPSCDKNNLETTYILNSPKKPPLKEKKFISEPTISSYDVTPLQVPKLKDEDNYDVSGLRSEDETDDEDEPNKPVPSWAKEPYLSQKAQTQSSLMVNFTRLFRSSCQQEVILENIFRVKRKKFTERSSSANWSSPPLWRTNGLTGEESFRKLHKNF